MIAFLKMGFSDTLTTILLHNVSTGLFITSVTFVWTIGLVQCLQLNTCVQKQQTTSSNKKSKDNEFAASFELWKYLVRK